MATTCKLIAKNVLGSAAASVTLSSIPATHTDLLLLVSCRGDTNVGSAPQYGTDFYLRLNGDTSNHSSRVLVGKGNSAYSTNPSSIRGVLTLPRATSSTFGNTEFYIPNYAGSTKKSVSVTSVQESNHANDVYIECAAGLWDSTSAVTSLEVWPYSGNFVADSSFYLFGITKS